MCDESGEEDEGQNDPMAAEGVVEYVNRTERRNERRVEPEEHPHGMRRPEVAPDPLHETAIQERFVKNMRNV